MPTPADIYTKIKQDTTLVTDDQAKIAADQAKLATDQQQSTIDHQDLSVSVSQYGGKPVIIIDPNGVDVVILQSDGSGSVTITDAVLGTAPPPAPSK